MFMAFFSNIQFQSFFESWRTTRMIILGYTLCLQNCFNSLSVGGAGDIHHRICSTFTWQHHTVKADLLATHPWFEYTFQRCSIWLRCSMYWACAQSVYLFKHKICQSHFLLGWNTFLEARRERQSYFRLCFFYLFFFFSLHPLYLPLCVSLSHGNGTCCSTIWPWRAHPPANMFQRSNALQEQICKHQIEKIPVVSLTLCS